MAAEMVVVKLSSGNQSDPRLTCGVSVLVAGV
jgi:hypothetical protein